MVDPDDWAALAEAGVFSLTLPEAAGGAGLGLADAAVVFEELGRGLVPGPLVASHLARPPGGRAGSAAARRRGRRLAGGRARLPGPGRRPALAGRAPRLARRPGGAGTRAAGWRSLDPGAWRTWRPGAAGRALPRPAHPASRWLTWPPGAGVARRRPATVAEWDDWPRVLTGALCVGIAAATCHLAVDHAKPATSSAGRSARSRRSSTSAPTCWCGPRRPGPPSRRPPSPSTSRAWATPSGRPPGCRSLAAEAAVANARPCVQVLGGMGFTWEVPVHLYLSGPACWPPSLGPLPALAATVAGRY